MTTPADTAAERSAGGYLRYPKADEAARTAHTKALAKTAKRRAKLQEQLDAIDEQLHEQIREGFRLGIGAQTIAAAASTKRLPISKPRAYQIRDGR